MGREEGEVKRSETRVSFEEAITVFGDPLSLNMPDPDHSEDEQGYLVLVTSTRGRLLLVAYAERPPRTRIISARTAARCAHGTNVVLLDPDVAEVFTDTPAVNEALRTFARLSKASLRGRTRQKRLA